MTTGRLNGKPVAPLSASLLARKGSADASGFANAPDAVSPAPAPQDAPAHPRILIVEDDLLNMELMTVVLEEQGYGTLQAANGEEAINMARAKWPDLIVMDINLPGLSGLDVIRQLKSDADLMDIPVIAVSAQARAEAEAMIRDAGFDEFLPKPFSVQSILHTVAGYLH